MTTATENYTRQAKYIYIQMQATYQSKTLIKKLRKQNPQPSLNEKMLKKLRKQNPQPSLNKKMHAKHHHS